MLPVDLAVNRPRLVWPLEVSAQLIASLRNLNVLYDCFAVVDVGGVNRPVATDVNRRLLGELPVQQA